MKTALVTGVNGQDGSYLAELLLGMGYRVVGTVRSQNPLWPYRFQSDQTNLEISYMDLGYKSSIQHVLEMYSSIDECYNLASQSHVGRSFDLPEETYAVTGVGACTLMDEYFKRFPEGKFYQASSSEMFGNRKNVMDGFMPESPYAVAKVMAHHNAKRHLESGKFCVAGILFNHESERRHESFVTQKICKAAAYAKKWEKSLFPHISDKPTLRLGNIESVRDWGYAPQYVKIMWLMMQEDNPETSTVIGTGVSTSVRNFAKLAYEYVGLDYKDFVVIDTTLYRPQEVHHLCASPNAANNLLGTELFNYTDLVTFMMENQLSIQGV